MVTGNDGMTLKDFSYTIPSISYNKLSVIIMADSFFYGIFNNENKLVAHQSYEGIRYSNKTSFEQILNDERLTKHHYDDISVLVLQENGYLTSTLEESITSLFPGLDHKIVYTEKLSESGLFYFFGITSYQKELLDLLFVNKNYEMRSLPANFSRWYRFSSKNIVHLHIENAFILIFMQKENKVVLSNFFKVNEINDILFFVLATCKATDIGLATETIFVSGGVEVDSPLFTTLNAYVADLQIVQSSNLFEDDQIAQASHPHHYFLHLSNVL
jgi:hypothetical protein